MLVNIGFGNVVSIQKIISVVAPDSQPVRRMLQEAWKTNRVIDATCGRKTRSAIITNSNHIVLSPLQPETVLSRCDEVKQ